MIITENIRSLDNDHFEILATTNRMLWLRSRLSGEEFIITDYNVHRRLTGKGRGYPWSVYHRHNNQELCHYHSNEKSFQDALRHIMSHDRKVIWQQQKAIHNTIININQQ